MAPQAYVFVYATPGKVEETASAIVEASTPKGLGQIVLQRIQRVPGVEATDTRIVVEV